METIIPATSEKNINEKIEITIIILLAKRICTIMPGIDITANVITVEMIKVFLYFCLYSSRAFSISWIFIDQL